MAAPMRLLFVKLKHIGDALLLSATLDAVRLAHPTAEIWVVVRRGTEGILRGCRAIDHLLTAAPPEAKNRGPAQWWNEVKLLLELRRQRFDYAFELTDGDRGRILVGFSGAANRCVNTSFYKLNLWWRTWFNRTSNREWTSGHRVEKDFHAVNDFLAIGSAPPPMRFDLALTQSWAPVAGQSHYAVLHPGTRWKRKRWPMDRWVEVGRWLMGKGLRVVVSAGPDAEEVAGASELVKALGGDAISTAGQLSWAHLAGLLQRARLFVGVDTAAMHLAAACQCPTVALFGPSSVSQWQPWRVAARVVQPRGIRWDGKSGGEELMGLIESADVIGAGCELLSAGGASPRLDHGTPA